MKKLQVELYLGPTLEDLTTVLRPSHLTRERLLETSNAKAPSTINDITSIAV
ncbi:uncharacterized protein G2W53_013424 [Senna tora]|uniref:Uncharacterized protein n=1 Tax=Senna tora TaxID=362788 RepID=A0A834U1U2_9FABA|nr:uncharacterized protein G2W53_013424 [Senna tora]